MMKCDDIQYDATNLINKRVLNLYLHMHTHLLKCTQR